MMETRPPSDGEESRRLISDADAALRDGQEQLRRANAHLSEAQRLSKTGSFTWNAYTAEDLWSEEMYRIFDLDPTTKMTWALVRQFIHPDDLPMVEAANANGRLIDEHDYILRIFTARGEMKYVRTVAHRSETDRHIFFGALQDVTASVKAEQALSQARAELTHVARIAALTALTASIAHEVNQPLAGILTNASTCIRMLAVDPPNLEGARATAQRTIRDANRAADVIKHLRSLFANKPPTMGDIDMNDTAQEVLKLSSAELQRRGVSLRTALAEDLPRVRGDRIQLQQVILNLVLNAADAMSNVTDRSRDLLVASGLDSDNRVRLSVRDAGVGLDSEGSEKIFDAFFTTKPDGMGIGLSISRAIVEAHEGRLWAESNAGAAGATFSFSVPGVGSPEHGSSAV